MIIPTFEKLSLLRHPVTPDPNLKAWNAADEYISQTFSDYSIETTANILVVNDQFGAITCKLCQTIPVFSLYNWTDSYLSKAAIKKNVQRNNLTSKIDFIDQCQSKLNPQYMFDYVFMRVPKHNSLLNFQLSTLSSHINEKTTVIAAGMTKEIHNSTIASFEKLIGPTKTSLAKKKARLIYSQRIKRKITTDKNITETSIVQLKLDEYGITSYAYPGVFSRDKFDLGCQVLLKHLPETLENQKLLDLGCGTGILGTVAAKQDPTLTVSFSDESFLAIESAKITFERNLNRSANYYVTDVLDNLENANVKEKAIRKFDTTDTLNPSKGFTDHGYFDHVLCNPPFHQQNVQTSAIANKMFKQSAQKLKANGELRVVANRHLKYQPILSQYFSKIRMLSKDPKFIVWLATDPKI